MKTGEFAETSPSNSRKSRTSRPKFAIENSTPGRPPKSSSTPLGHRKVEVFAESSMRSSLFEPPPARPCRGLRPHEPLPALEVEVLRMNTRLPCLFGNLRRIPDATRATAAGSLDSTAALLIRTLCSPEPFADQLCCRSLCCPDPQQPTSTASRAKQD